MRFWVAEENNEILDIIGLADPLPKVLSFAQTLYPGEIKILYVDSNRIKAGIGRALVTFIESEAVKQNYKELLLRSALRYKDTAWGFYQKMGYETVGMLKGEDGGEEMQVFRKELQNN